jgi:aminoglycoside phosphotransferase (APT) family kinase protein
MPAAEVDIDAPLVRRLLESQHPDLAGLPLRSLASGWDNAVYRLGDELTVRLPRRSVAAILIGHEQRWLPELAPLLPLPVPTPLRFGLPDAGYPWRWSVCRWLPGAMAAVSPPDDPARAAEVLGGFVAAMARPAPTEAPRNPYRGVPLADRSEVTEARIDQMAESLDAPAVRARWRELSGVAAWTGPPVWLHGDLHPANIVVHDGRLAAVVDFGDLTSGDPATDLGVAWMLFTDAERRIFRASAGCTDDDTWARARGWALQVALAMVATSADNPVIAGIGATTLAAVMADRS